MSLKNYYEILGISFKATKEDIVEAFEVRKTELLGTNGQIANSNREIYSDTLEAFGVLSKRVSRNNYDVKYFFHFVKGQPLDHSPIKGGSPSQNLTNGGRASNAEDNQSQQKTKSPEQLQKEAAVRRREQEIKASFPVVEKGADQAISNQDKIQEKPVQEKPVQEKPVEVQPAEKLKQELPSKELAPAKNTSQAGNPIVDPSSGKAKSVSPPEKIKTDAGAKKAEAEKKLKVLKSESKGKIVGAKAKEIPPKKGRGALAVLVPMLMVGLLLAGGFYLLTNIATSEKEPSYAEQMKNRKKSDGVEKKDARVVTPSLPDAQEESSITSEKTNNSGTTETVSGISGSSLQKDQLDQASNTLATVLTDADKEQIRKERADKQKEFEQEQRKIERENSLQLNRKNAAEAAEKKKAEEAATDVKLNDARAEAAKKVKETVQNNTQGAEGARDPGVLQTQKANTVNPLTGCAGPYVSALGEGSYKVVYNNRLKVQNPKSKGAVLQLINSSSGRVVRNVYVPAMSSCEMNYIPKGRYYIRAYFGNNWDGSQKKGRYHGVFSSDQEFLSFRAPDGSSIDLREKNRRIEVLLGGSGNGNILAQKKSSSREFFR